MRGRLLLLVAMCVATAASAGAQQGRTPAGKRPTKRVQQPRRCVLEFERPAQREGVRVEPFAGNENYYIGGDVRLKCRGQNVRVGADSVESINGEVVRFITKAYYRDDDLSLKADTLTYYQQGERLEARGNVIVVNLADSSTLKGPHLDYLRAVRGVRDSAEAVSMLRPTLTVVPKRAKGDTASKGPYVIVADLLRGFGSSRLSGRGNVTIDRDDLVGRGDSLLYTTGTAGQTILTGTPASWRRTGADSFTVTGRDIRLALTDEVLDDLRAYGDGKVVQDSTRVTGDSVALQFVDGKLARTDAWGKETLAHVTREGYDIVGDSVAIVAPGEELQSINVFGRGQLQNPIDTAVKATPTDSAETAPDRDTLWGNRIEARFAQVDSAGTRLTRVTFIEAIGSARSLMTQSVERNGVTTPTVNYSLADTITITMKAHPGNGFEEVRMRGNVQGLQLETASVGKKVAVPATRRTP
ncbi:MAG: hypothetical protein SFU84_09365 [Gemmatimonadales bacterium]|nr:hypothetical protein [Gemmatimonadales bacterium]